MLGTQMYTSQIHLVVMLGTQMYTSQTLYLMPYYLHIQFRILFDIVVLCIDMHMKLTRDGSWIGNWIY
jgi:hypothetical protein